LSTPRSTIVMSCAVLVDGIASAIADRAELTPEQKQARAAEVWTMLDQFQPQDALQVMLIGQAMVFNDLIADGARDILGGKLNSLKLRAQSNLNGMNRALHQNLGLFLRLRDKAAAAASEASTAAVAEPRQPRRSAAKAQAQAPAEPAAAPPARPVTAQTEAAPNAGDGKSAPRDAAATSPATAPVAEPSWLDEPYTTWVIETPAAAHARGIAEPEALAAADEAPRPAEVQEFDEAMLEPRVGPRRRAASADSAASASARVAVRELVGTS